MPLSFTPHGAIYDPTTDLMRFSATDGALLVRCGVSKNALLALDPELPRGGANDRAAVRAQSAAD